MKTPINTLINIVQTLLEINKTKNTEEQQKMIDNFINLYIIVKHINFSEIAVFVYKDLFDKKNEEVIVKYLYNDKKLFENIKSSHREIINMLDRIIYLSIIKQQEDIEYLTTEEATKFLCTNTITLLDLVKQGQVPAIAFKSRYRFLKSDLIQFMESQRIQPDKPIRLLKSRSKEEPSDKENIVKKKEEIVTTEKTSNKDFKPEATESVAKEVLPTEEKHSKPIEKNQKQVLTEDLPKQNKEKTENKDNRAVPKTSKTNKKTPKPNNMILEDYTKQPKKEDPVIVKNNGTVELISTSNKQQNDSLHEPQIEISKKESQKQEPQIEIKKEPQIEIHSKTTENVQEKISSKTEKPITKTVEQEPTNTSNTSNTNNTNNTNNTSNTNTLENVYFDEDETDSDDTSIKELAEEIPKKKTITVPI